MSALKKSATRTAMSTRLLELHNETNDPQPYPITEDIVVTPLTRTRSEALKAAELEAFYYKQVLGRRLAVMVAVQPPQLPADAADEQVEEYEAALKEWTAAFDIKSIKQQITAAESDYERAFFGEAHDAVIEFFEDKPALWDRFLPDIKAHLLPPGPDDGTCATCGRTDADLAGKALESSTSSTTTGT